MKSPYPVPGAPKCCISFPKILNNDDYRNRTRCPNGRISKSNNGDYRKHNPVMCSTQYRTHFILLHLSTHSVPIASHHAVISNTCRYRLDTDREICDTSIPTLISPGPYDEMVMGSEEDITHPHTHLISTHACVHTYKHTN